MTFSSAVQAYADTIAAELSVWQNNGPLVGVDLGCWHDLHAIVDTGQLTDDAGVPWGADVATDDDPAGVRWITAVEHRLDEMIHTAAGTPACHTVAGGVS
jgi:hypothetical protein